MLLLQQASKFFPGVIHSPHQLLYYRYFLRSNHLINKLLYTQLQVVCLPIHQHRTRNYASSESGQVTICIFMQYIILNSLNKIKWKNKST